MLLGSDTNDMLHKEQVVDQSNLEWARRTILFGFSLVGKSVFNDACRVLARAGYITEIPLEYRKQYGRKRKCK